VHDYAVIPVPTKVAKTYFGGGRLESAYYITKSGTKLYAVGPGLFTILDVTTPQTPTILGSVSSAHFGSSVSQVVVSGNFAYVNRAGTTGYDLVTVDISTPASPVVVASSTDYSTIANSSKLIVSGSHLYVSGGGNTTVSAWTLAAPAKPVYSGGINTAGSRGMAISGSYAYTCDSSGSQLNIVNISVPTALTYATYANAALSTCKHVAISGSYLYTIGESSNQLSVFSIATPSSPTFVGSITNAALSGPVELEASTDYVYVTR
ncbi:MAG: hypothetical protein V4760_13570, partial [Bdellovibrionota bacterium]